MAANCSGAELCFADAGRWAHGDGLAKPSEPQQSAPIRTEPIRNDPLRSVPSRCDAI